MIIIFWVGCMVNTKVIGLHLGSGYGLTGRPLSTAPWQAEWLDHGRTVRADRWADRWPGFGGKHPKLMAVELLMTCVSKKVLSHLGFRVCKLEPLQAWEILPLQILRKIGPLSGSACNWESSEEARGSMVDSSILSAFRTLERWSNAQLNPRVLVLFDRILLYFESPEDIYIYI